MSTDVERQVRYDAGRGALVMADRERVIGADASNRQVLEISNVSKRPLAIHAGTRLCQIVLQRCEGSAVYAGRFATQERL